jgi:hypothetical protein
MLGVAIGDCCVGIPMAFPFYIRTQGRTKRAAKVTATEFSNVRCYFSVTVGQGEAYPLYIDIEGCVKS